MDFDLLGDSIVIGNGPTKKKASVQICSPSKWYLAISASTTCNAPVQLSVGHGSFNAATCGQKAYSVEHDFQGWTGIARCKKHHPKGKPVSNPSA